MNCYTWLSLLLTLGQLWPCLPSMQNHNIQKMNQPFATLQRVKRGWVWSQFFVLEEQILTEPLSVGQVRSVGDTVT
uniref:Uncharacterized protein n=1 Tax=Chrysemys picta bellii TaxID=8478 RepID=A0A8C3FUJ5_CHRPI